ncbi:uncharacterized protein LOC116163660 isoform X2 [Photinus pyralis]|uniref:uncharacterized protein LOC116163660 isoform X2 n=1 Tax=Photinus pyralis TaxID=7054 RepID=UPI001266FFD6|nr:uncharacterized protein LOC116163660 isoform X2 [Photinus pyralis]
MGLFDKRRQKHDSRQLEDSDFNSKNSNSVQVWSSTIQILLPIAALAFIWGRRGLLTRFFLQFEKNCVSAICPSLNEKQKLLQWIDWHLPTSWLHSKNSALDNPIHCWTDGSLLCNLINTYIPGACPNPQSHKHHPPSHGQALAYKYLGIAPVFTDQDFEQDVLSQNQELALVQYLKKIREACEQETKPALKYSSNYVAKGMGLFSGEENRKMAFYIYVNSSDYFNVDDIIVSIQAPSGVYETLRIPSTFIEQKLLFSNKFAYQSHSETLLLKPISDLSTSTEPQGNGHTRKIPMTFSVEEDRIKVTYIPRSMGIHEVSIITSECHVVGSPFAVSILQNVSGVCEDFELNSLPTVAVRKTIKRTILSQTIDLLDLEPVSDPHEPRKVNHVVEEHIEMNYVTKSLQANETSPICEDHIAYEVTTNHKSSLIPQRNPEKILDNGNSISTPNMHTTLDEERSSSPSKTEIQYENGSRENALNILNYLPHLKYDRSVSCNELSTSLEQSLNLIDDEDCFEFKKKLSFWEDRSNFGTIKKKLKQRRSLPDLLLGNASGELFESYDNSEFKSKQKYWKFLSSQTIDCMESTSYYSLPNVFTHRENHARYRLYPYFDSMDFKTKFKECREFWERLSTQYCSNDSFRIMPKASSEPDSGFEHSEAFETPRSTSPSDLDVKTFDHSVFHERQVFWERLKPNRYDTNQLKHDNRFKQMSQRTLNNKSKEYHGAQFVNRSGKEKCFFNEIPLKSEDRNLTDDFKSLGGTRENMKMRFYKNKDFFRSLEGSIR